MAPGNISKKTRQPPAANVRAKTLERVAQLAEKEGEENKRKIQEYEEMLKQKDEELEALTNDQLRDIGFDEMDIDTDKNEMGYGAENVGGKQGEDQAKEENEVEKKNAGSNKPLPSNDNDQAKQVTFVPETPIPSIERDASEGAKGDENLFVPESKDAEKSKSDSDFVDPELGRPLFSLPGSGSTEDGETVAWVDLGRGGNAFINRYGKKSVGTYRVSSMAISTGYEKKDEQKATGDGKINIRHIYAVAWKNSSMGHMPQDLDLIDPAHGRGFRGIVTYVFITQQMDNGETRKRWVTRTTVRKSWGNKIADNIIYKAAVEAETRYMEAETGKRQAFSRSPSVGLAQELVDRQRGNPVDRSSSSLSRSPTPVSRYTRSPTPVVSHPVGAVEREDARVKFLAGYLELMGLTDFSDLSPSQQAKCTNAWSEMRNLMYVEATA